jgi:peptidoglycan/xylan/chitin deacetylase (PgdA/CDA1 family)
MKGEKILPKKSFLLTFDDGRKDSFYPVDPVLKKLNYNAVILITF